MVQALILIDYQCGFDDPDWGPRNNPAAEANGRRLLAAWRDRGQPVFIVQHASTSPSGHFRPGSQGHALKPGFDPRPGEGHVVKRVHSALIGTDLEARLRAAGVQGVVVAGLTTDHCVSTTVRMASDLGFATIMVADACATFAKPGPDGEMVDAETVHRVNLASLNGEFARVMTTEAVLAEA